MAFRPTHRRKRTHYIVDLNLAPLLSLFVALIPMLLLTAIFQQVGIVNLYLPTTEESMQQPGDTGATTDFTLAISISPTELTLRKGSLTLFRDVVDDGLDLSGLGASLAELKSEFPGKRDIVLLLDGSILYQTIIQVMDTVREHEGKELFPDISLADRVVEVR
ncbi:MAG: hypothetical protein GXP52_04290 [Deltaproteobacteria bacterium]|nr:hypothetical protein [Deltaproteobacteria bacterium]